MSETKKPVRLIIAGAGGRGVDYAMHAKKEGAEIVGVADPLETRREILIREHGIPAEHVFKDWREMAARDKFADAVVISTQDAMHADPAVAFAKKGYAILLEKPMAPNADDCRRIVQAVTENDTLFAVCHVLRYTDYTQTLKQILDSGRIGEVVSLQHFEPVGYWHQAHSYVRGNWRNEASSSFMLLAKSCHDMDWMAYIMGAPCRCVSSFGSLRHFHKEHQPAGATDRCLDCGVEESCPYSAKRIYLKNRAEQEKFGWPVNVLTSELTCEGVTEALRSGPYGRCVYACDNDVVDHQVVNMDFEGGRTASFTMTAFTAGMGRETKIFGTHGMIVGDSSKIRIHDFLTEKKEVIDTRAADASILGGHGGGDTRLIQAFVAAVAENDRSRILSGPAETLQSHLMTFAAEQARRENRVVEIDDQPPPIS